jgi:hypothetical protein
MAPLLTITQQQQIKPISPNWATASKNQTGVTNYEQLAAEVEESKLRKLVGNALLQDLQTNPTAAANITLLNGSTFTGCDGEAITFKGLRFVLAYLNWHSYVSQSFVSDTFTGLVQKNRTESERITSGDIKRLQVDAEDIAMVQWQLCESFLNQNKSTYPKWKGETNARPFTPRITGIRKTLR